MPAATAGGLTHYYGEGSNQYAEGSGQGFAFDYPSSWEVISGFHEVYTHGPTVMVAVGIGDYDINCTGSLPGSVDCGDPIWTVPDGGVVLVYHLQDWPQGSAVPFPSPNVGPNDRWVQIDGRTALFSQDAEGDMSWSLLGTPEIIEARFGQGVASSAPQQIQAVIDSWKWSAPVATPRATPVTTGGGSATWTWQQVGDAQGGIDAFWAPDSNHLMVVLENANEFDQMELFDRSGNSLVSTSGLYQYPWWLNSSVVEGYEDNSVPGYRDEYEYHMVPGRSISVSDPTSVSVNLPCCEPLSNGHGALAVTRFLPEQVQDLTRPKFVVWQDGVESAEHEGVPIAWDAAGDKLLVVHPTEANPYEYDGWLEVFSWPDLTSLYKDDPSNVISQAEFDPTGRYVSYEFLYQDASDKSDHEIHVIDLDGGNLVKIPIAGDPAEMSSSHAWDDQGNLLVMSQADKTLYTYSPDGTQVQKSPASDVEAIQASQNGATILTSGTNGDSPTEMRITRDGVTQPLTPPGDEIQSVVLSPDGSQVFIVVGTNTGVAGYLADIP